MSRDARSSTRSVVLNRLVDSSQEVIHGPVPASTHADTRLAEAELALWTVHCCVGSGRYLPQPDPTLHISDSSARIVNQMCERNMEARVEFFAVAFRGRLRDRSHVS